MNTRDMILCDMLQNNIWQISVSERVQFFSLEHINIKNFRFSKFETLVLRAVILSDVYLIV